MAGSQFTERRIMQDDVGEPLDRLADECAAAARLGLLAAGHAMRSPRRRNAHDFACELATSSGELARHLEIAETARRQGQVELAEEGFHRAVNLMVELRCRAGAHARLSATGMA